MADSNADFNAQLINEFRENDGLVGGTFEGTPLLLLHHTGSKSGANRVNPVGYLRDGERYFVIASNGGAPTRPAWYHNVKAQPDVTIEVGTATIDVVAHEASGDEHQRLYRLMVERYPHLTEYAQKAGRPLPVIVLTPR
jgi:deazaflavin-dependent oxidoreductase (nitroreductase family)